MTDRKKDNKIRKSVSLYLGLHACLFLSSLSGVASKKAAGEQFASFKWMFFYGIVLAIMFLYAIFWQQIIKRMPLTVAYANKPVSLIWGLIWGAALFHETITWKMLIGAGIIFLGIFLVVISDE